MKKLNGFTLVELVLVISIVVVLSVISGPIYRSYAYKARQAEGYALLGTIRSAQESYFGEYGTFLYTGNRSTVTCNNEILGIDARPNKYYTVFCAGTGSGNGKKQMPFGFRSWAYGNGGVANLMMEYNRTSGVTMFSGSLSNIEDD